MADKQVIGEPLDKTVVEQLQARANKQNNFGSRSTDDVLYMGTKNAWVRMSSFIRLTPGSSGAAKYGGGFDLAKKWVLSAEAKNAGGAFKYGVAVDTGAYGTGGIDEVGYRPMPGIYSVSTESQPPLGAVRSATIKVKAWNLDQLSIIDILYFRLGCCILLEWGHSLYVDNKGNTRNDIQPLDIFKDDVVCPEDLLKDLKKKRELYSHNYDGMIGRIVNYTWSQSPDGSYDCEIKAVGLGTVIESLKINGQASMPIPIEPAPVEAITDPNAAPNSNQVAKPADSGLTLFLTNIESYPMTTIASDIETKCFTGIKTLEYRSVLAAFRTNVVKIVDGQPQNPSPNTFIPLGLLLAYLNNCCLMYSEGCKTKKPIITIDYNPEKNLCMRLPHQFSVDPGICLVYTQCDDVTYNNLFLYKDVSISDIVSPEPISPSKSTIMTSLSTVPKYPSDTQDVGKIMNIMVNTECIKATVEECTDSDKNVMLSMFLSKLMEKIQAALGNINNFTVSIDEDTNVLKIIDAQIVDGASLPKLIPELPIFGLNSIAREVNITTEIGSNMASMLAITARAGARNTGTNQDASSFSRLNNSIEDRLFPKITDIPSEEVSTPPSAVVPFAAPAAAPAVTPAFGAVISGQAAIATANANVAATAAANASLAVKKGITQLANTFNAQIAACYRLGDDSDVIKYDQAAVSSINQFYIDAMLIAKNKGITPKGDPSSVTATGVLPIALNITLDGIGGIPRYQSFAVPIDRLPEAYKDDAGKARVAFIVTGINNIIEGNQWVTKLRGQMFNIPGGYSTTAGQFTGSPKISPKKTTLSASDPSVVKAGNGNWSTLNATLKAISAQAINGDWKEARTNPKILAAFKEVGNDWAQSDSVPWCAGFTGYALKTSGLSYIKTLSSTLYKGYGVDVPLNDRNQWKQWDIVVFIHPDDSSKGHVGFLYGASADGQKLTVFGGNQSDNVKLSTFSKNGKGLKVLAIRRGGYTDYPATLPLNTSDQSATTR